MLSAALNIGASGLMTSQLQADNASRNIANQDTPGYRRVDTSLQTLVNGGVHGSTFQRFDTTVASRISQLAGDVSFADTQSKALNQTQAVLSDASSQVSSAMNEFRAALSTMAYNPTDATAATMAASKGQSLAAVTTLNIKSLDDQIADLKNSQATVKGQAQAKLAELVSLNKAVGYSGATPDLKDQLAQTGKELSQLMGGQVTFTSSGQAQFTVSGVMVVNGTNTTDLPDTFGGQLGGLADSEAQVTATRDKLQASVAAYADGINKLNANAGQGPVFDTTGGGLSFVGSSSNWGVTPTGATTSVAKQMADVGSLATDVSSLAAQTASAASLASTNSSASTSSLTAIEEVQQKQEGVNPDLEFINLTSAQKAYEANAKLIQVADSMLGTLLNIKA